jgi:flavin reductase (DIM6/NTAB) family NADH-FMN oxidoreductase RutF
VSTRHSQQRAEAEPVNVEEASSLFYRPGIDPHGLRYDPFTALVVPRPVGWITTVGSDGLVNLAPYSFFNAVVRNPPVVAFAANGVTRGGDQKDTIENLRRHGEFVVNVATVTLSAPMMTSARELPAAASEVEVSGLSMLPGRVVSVPRIAESPAHLECRLHAIQGLPGPPGRNWLVTGHVVGIHIRHEVFSDGRVDMTKLRPLARLGYLDYGTIAEIWEMRVAD